ncbi:MAG: hypothetical protein IJ410_01040 [Oscillospiraceae bacterium]|nr:hypothetical protein [Oscillospiraceae bacterium]
MEYPLKIDVNISQDDYIQVEILEQELEAQLWKKSIVKTFIIESVVLALAAVLVMTLAAKKIIVIETMIFVVGAWLIFLFLFVYNYFWGVKREFNLAVQHVLRNKDTHEFFTPEKGMIYFYEDRCEFLTNEQRRYFDYSLIKNIKVIKHLYIFVMKRSKEKNLRGFAYMVVPRRDMYPDEDAMLAEICDGIVEKYKLEPWVESELLK